MLLSHDIQLNLLWFSEILLCIVTLLCARMPKWRTSCLVIFTMGALDLSLWNFFADISGDPTKYRAYLSITLIFMMMSLFLANQYGTTKNLKFLCVLSLLHFWEWIDLKINPNESFIDSNYALLVALTFLLYNISHKGTLIDAWNYHKLHRFDRKVVPNGLGCNSMRNNNIDNVDKTHKRW